MIGPFASQNLNIKLSTSAIEKTFSGAGNNVSADMTIVTQQPALSEFYGVSLLYANYSTAGPITITIAKCAAAPTHQNDGTALSWVNVLFSGSATVTIPAATGTGNDIVPSVVMSDFINIASVARTDDTTKLPLLQTRSYGAAAWSAVNAGAGDLANFNANSASGGAQFGSRIPSGDQVTTIVAQIPVETGTFLNPVAVKFYYSKKSFTLLSVGDSLTRGQGSTSNALGWPKRVQGLLKTARINYNSCNFGWSGQKIQASHSIAKNLISLKPNALSFYAWSPNDGITTQALMDTYWASTLELAEICRQNNIIPILCTSGPVNSYTSAQNTIRVSQNNRIRASGITYIDIDSVIANPANPAQILPAYDSGDGLHYNDAGYAASANLGASIMSPVVNAG